MTPVRLNRRCTGEGASPNKGPAGETSLRLLNDAVETCGEEDALVAGAAAGDDGEDLGSGAAPSDGVGVGVYKRSRGVVVA